MATYSKFTDQELTALLKQADHEAFTEIYNRYKGVLYAHAYNKLRNREEVTDLLQELFSQLWNNRINLEISITLSAYLYGMTRNMIFKLIRHKEVSSRYYVSLGASLDEGFCETDYLVREKQLSQIIEAEIDALPEKMRAIFLLSRKDKLSHAAIAKQLNIAEPTVKKQVNNALKILRTKLSLFAWIVFLIRY